MRTLESWHRLHVGCPSHRRGFEESLQTDPVQSAGVARKREEKKTPRPCLENRRHLAPLVRSADGLLGREAKTFAKLLAVKLAGKWQKPCSEVCGGAEARLSMAAVRAAHSRLRGSRVPASRVSAGFPRWEDGAGSAARERSQRPKQHIHETAADSRRLHFENATPEEQQLL